MSETEGWARVIVAGEDVPQNVYYIEHAYPGDRHYHICEPHTQRRLASTGNIEDAWVIVKALNAARYLAILLDNPS